MSNVKRKSQRNKLQIIQQKVLLAKIRKDKDQMTQLLGNHMVISKKSSKQLTFVAAGKGVNKSLQQL